MTPGAARGLAGAAGRRDRLGRERTAAQLRRHARLEAEAQEQLGPARPAWHVGDWGPLGWAETALKTAGVLVGIAALLTALGREPDGASGARLAAVAILGVLSLGLVAGIADRVLAREVVGVVFILGMVAGHVAMTVALARDAGLEGFLLAFAVLMLAGDLVKLAFLRRTGFRVRDLPPAVVYGLTAAYAAGYLALLLIAPVV